MFDAIRKILINEDWQSSRRGNEKDPEWWKHLREGATLRFGLMQSPELSAKEFKVKALVEYRFAERAYTAFQLTNAENFPLQLVVADGGERERYLAISRPLQPRDIERLFAEEDAKRIYKKDLPKRLYAREHTPGLRDWVTMQYRAQLLSMKGKRQEQGRITDVEYSLFVNDGNSRAIEFEYDAEGKIQLYVTLYRPMSDVVHVRHAALPPPPPPAPAPAQEKAKPAAAKVEAPVTTLKEPAADKKLAKEGPALMSASAAEAVAVPKSNVAEKFSCDIKVASRLIDEAMRNNMPLADVVRKILGLKLDMHEQVSFSLPLSKEDYRTLALRYQLEPTDRSAILHHIGEELSIFAGDRSIRK